MAPLAKSLLMQMEEGSMQDWIEEEGDERGERGGRAHKEHWRERNAK